MKIIEGWRGRSWLPLTPFMLALVASPVSAQGLETQVSRDGFSAHAETNVAANPRHSGNLVGVSIVYQGPKGTNPALATHTSTDNGVHWQDGGVLPASANGRDPSVMFNAAGQGFVAGDTDIVSVWRTDDGGKTFQQPVAVTHGEKVDHPWVVADAAPEGQAAHNLYVVYTMNGNTQLGFNRSIDDGRTFEPTRSIATASAGSIVASPMIAAGRDGTVCATYGIWPPSAAMIRIQVMTTCPQPSLANGQK